MLSKEQILRYSRQLILPQVGVKGQQRLLESSVLVVGAGGLGSPAAFYLAAAGIGRIGIIDRGTVELSNLHRQILHVTLEVGHPKTASAKARLAALNPEVQIVEIQESINPLNVRALLGPYDVVLDGSDNFTTRYLVNDTCVLAGKPFVYGGVVELRGQVLTIVPGHSACLRCVFPEPPQAGAILSCQEAGVLGTAAGIVGSLMAHEAIKWLLEVGEPLTDRLLVFDGSLSRFRHVPVRRDPTCAACGDTPTIHEPVAIDEAVCRDERPGDLRQASDVFNKEAGGAWRRSK